MAHHREIPCEYYICIHNCARGRKDAEHAGICQRCSKYKPRAKVKLLNKKKAKLEKIQRADRNY